MKRQRKRAVSEPAPGMVLMLYTGHSGIDPGVMPWAPVVVQAHIPARAYYAESPVAILASLNDYALIDNLGHALFDFAYPVRTLYHAGCFA